MITPLSGATDYGPMTSDEQLRFALYAQPDAFGNRYTHAADCELKRTLFRSLARDEDEYLRLMFPEGAPPDRSEPWSIKKAQGAMDGAEYTAAAKGTACGHIFKSGESTYHCKTCAADDTCVLCSRCFEGSDHEGHTVFISVSPGNSGCCDCGDSEAWRKEVNCSIHTDKAQNHKQAGKEKAKSPSISLDSELPIDLVEAIRMTIARCMDYVCDVFSCSPENMRSAKSEATIHEDERLSRLFTSYGGRPEPAAEEYALVLWNDEKHTVDDVQNQVARACRQTKRFGLEKAMEVNDVGRSVVTYSKDLPELLRMATVIEQLKVTVTIRSSRDTFREQMCATIIDWFADISGAAVGSEPHLLRNVVCEEMLKVWRIGSEASNKRIGRDGLDDHELEELERLRRQYRRWIQPFGNVIQVQVQEDDNVNDSNDGNDDNDNEEDEEDDDDDNDNMDIEGEEMDIEIEDLQSAADAAMGEPEGADMDVDFLDENEDATEALEATLAGYPPPPPPPRRRRILTPAESEDGDATPEATRPAATTFGAIPKTPRVRNKTKKQRPGQHWLEKPQEYYASRPSEPGEDLQQLVRLDSMIVYDLRLWKVLRIKLRHLYITTVVTVPHFKRILGLRFASLYTHLAQLYLIADREPDHSIINLSVQMLTTPTITQEVVDRGNFLTNLMAILYTFLTTRQVGWPEEVSSTATLAFDAGAVTNRRMFHFFLDLRWLFQSHYVHYRMRIEPRYLLQFLDLAKLHQGICPNVRALGEHVEYESDAWISASMITKEMNKLCKQVAFSFDPNPEAGGLSDGNLQRATRTVAQMALINSMGLERKRFVAAELKDELTFHLFGPVIPYGKIYSLPRCSVQSEPMSFHHPLHYLLSWLIEAGKSLDREEMRALLAFSKEDLRDPWNDRAAQPQLKQDSYSSDELLAAIFDIPARVVAWLAQMKAGMWVRNGITLRHQAHTYRSVMHRDLGYQRDLLLVQAGLVLTGGPLDYASGSIGDHPGESFLLQLIDRFQMQFWIEGDYRARPGFEESQHLDCIEDFFHLLVIVLSDRRNLVASTPSRDSQDKILQHDIAHALCFKPLSFSDLSVKVTEKVSDSDDFNRILDSMTIYKPPEGLSDTGTFELKSEYVELVDPYYAHFSRNQREEAENVYKKHMARKTGKKAEDVVYEPTLEKIESGLFVHLATFTRSRLFLQVVWAALNYALEAVGGHSVSKLQVTRIETFLHMVLHLVVLAVQEDSGSEEGFVNLAVTGHIRGTSSAQQNVIVSSLIALSGKDEYASCQPTIKHILRNMQQSQPEKLISTMGALASILDRSDTASPASLSAEDKEAKKQAALARQAKVMAQMKQQQNSFLQNQGLAGFGDGFDDIEDDMSITDEPLPIEQRKIWSFPSGTCILCQEETDDQRLFGTFGFVGESKILRSTPTHDVDFVQEVVDSPTSLDRPADDIRPFGVAGKNKHIVNKVGFGGEVVSSERQGLSKGFPQNKCSTKGPVATSCGHIMHFSCFELYLAATSRRHAQQIARNHPENIHNKEFVCPLCKALGNHFFPVVWKQKECVQEHELHAAKSFSDFLAESASTYQPDLSFLDGDLATALHHQQGEVRFTHRAQQYITDMFAPTLVSSMQELSIARSSQSTPTEPRYQLRRGLSFSSIFGGRHRASNSQSSIENPILPSSPTDQQSRTAEVARAYERVEDSIRANKLYTPAYSVHQQYTSTFSPLSRALGFTIASLEIAHRGSNHDPLATSFIVDISEQAITQLRILSETIESYLAVKMLQGRPGANFTAAEIIKKRDVMTALLFGMESEIKMIRLKEIAGGFLFEDDVFLFFADWLFLMSPNVAEATSILELCLWAELVKVVHVYKTVLKDDMIRTNLQMPRRNASNTDAFSASVQGIVSSDTRDPYSNIPLPVEQADALQVLMKKYAVAFLRKCILLMYVRYGLDYECPYNLDPEAPELERLTALLHISSIEAMCEIFVSRSDAGDRLRRLTRQWIQQAVMVTEHAPPGSKPISVPHPAIFELIGLPKNYDTLTEEATKRSCPTTGKEITDPAVCLFCGDIFCSQALCCMKGKSKGGCYQHMQKCGGTVGIFITIRKCMVIFMHLPGDGGSGTADGSAREGRNLHPGNGSYAHAPYLDKHGEPDPTLRRHHQLFLNQRRYDKLLRDAWLNHMIPTVISRKLESDINPGGWETL